MSDGRQREPARQSHQFGNVKPIVDRPKTITLYVNGDEHFYGKTMNVSRRLTHTWETFLREATERTGVMFAVRNVVTPTHGSRINSLEELVDGSSYVVLCKGNFKPIG